MKKKILFVVLLSIILLLIINMVLMFKHKNKENKNITTVTIAVFQDNKVHNFETNYYKLWLEKKTGYKIKFDYITKGYEKEYIDAMLTSNNNIVDAIFFPYDKDILKIEEFNTYVKKGLVKNLYEYISKDNNLYNIIQKYKSNSSNFIYDDGEIYFVPSIDTARKTENMQVMWINSNWLEKLELEIPSTTNELKNVLIKFRDNDPNENGKKDELPLISCEENYSFQSYNFILNSYCYNDPFNLRLYIDGDKLQSSVLNEDFKTGIKYCNNLYEQNLISNKYFDCSKKTSNGISE